MQGREDKKVALEELLAATGIEAKHAAYMGDDLPDLGAIIIAGFGITVPNAHSFVKQHADHCTQVKGGEGAVREICDYILDAKGVLNLTLSKFLP